MKQAAKTTQKSTKKSDKRQLSSVLKVLRPKVYITDSSSFKKLVQKLTGKEVIISPKSPTQTQQYDYSPMIQVAHDSHFFEEVCHELNSLSPIRNLTTEKTSKLVPEVDLKLAYEQKNDLWSVGEDPGQFFDDCIFETQEEVEFLPCLQSYNQLEDLHSIMHS